MASATTAAENQEPVRLDLTSGPAVARWRPFVQWLLAIPHLIVLGVLGFVLGILEIVNFFTVLFTKSIPPPLFDFQVMMHRYAWRTYSYAMFLRETYPPFDFGTSEVDPGGDPAELTIERPAELHRWLPLVKWLLIIPHMIVLFFLTMALSFMLLVAAFAVLFTGTWPLGLRIFAVNVSRWTMRVVVYTSFLRDEYPPFRLG